MGHLVDHSMIIALTMSIGSDEKQGTIQVSTPNTLSDSGNWSIV